jgi:hypothetical protein
MAKITDPDDLNQGTEIVIEDTGSKTIQLLVAGNLSTDGVSLRTVYSFLKEEWKDDPDLIKFPFPMIAITEEQFEMVNGWDWADTTTRELIRDGGWALKDSGGVSEEEWMNVTTLGSFDDPNTDLAYYLQINSGSSAPTDFVYTGPVNEAVKIYGDVTHGNFDYRGFFKPFLREYAKTYDSYSLLSEQGITALTYKKYALPLSNLDDIKVTHDDTATSGSQPYVDITISFFDTPFQRTIGVGTYDFDILIDSPAAEADAEEIYERVQYLLRQASDINSGSGGGVRRGEVTDELLSFVGNTLVTADGVYIDGFQPADTNRIQFYDTGGTLREFPFVATGRITFNQYLQADADAYYWMFYNSGSGAYGGPNAIIVQDSDDQEIKGLISAAAYADFDYDYDFNDQGGLGGGNPKPVIVVAIGLEDAQFVSATMTIQATTTNNVSLVSALERNYENV